MTEKEYRALPSEEYFSSSLLSDFARNGPSVLKKRQDISSLPGVRFGSMAHAMALLPDEFDSKYKVISHDVNDSFKQLAERLVEELLTNNISMEDVLGNNNKYISLAAKIVEETGIWKHIKKRETLTGRLEDREFIYYLKELYLARKENSDITIISSDDYLAVSLLSKVLRENEYTKDFFVSKDISKLQILFEIPLIYNIQDRKCKSMLDIILIDHEHRTLRFADLKTGAESYNTFEKKFHIMRYDIQAGMYTSALEEFARQNNLKNYRILDPIYIYVSRNEVELPVPFVINEGLIRSSFTTYIDIYNNRVKGILELMDDIDYHRKHKSFDYPVKILRDRMMTIGTNDTMGRRVTELPFGFFGQYTRNVDNSNTEYIGNDMEDDINAMNDSRRMLQDHIDNLTRQRQGRERTTVTSTGNTYRTFGLDITAPSPANTRRARRGGNIQG